MLILESLTVGLPFCAFKIITGHFYSQQWLIILGIFDIVINVLNVITLLIFKKRYLYACTFSNLVKLIKRPREERKIKWEDFGNSLDMALSFILVALMIAKGNLSELPSTQLAIWNLSVVFNVLGAGLGRVANSIIGLAQRSYEE